MTEQAARRIPTTTQRQFALQKAVEVCFDPKAAPAPDSAGAILDMAGKFADFLANGPKREGGAK